MAKLTVKNVGPIREAEFEVKKHTVFIGPQGSGKSTLAKLIAIGGDNEIVLGSDVNQDISKKYTIHTYINNNSIFNFATNTHSIKYINSKIELVYEEDQEQPVFSEKTFNDFLSYMRDSSDNVKLLVESISDRVLFEKLLTKFTIEQKILTIISSYIPAERILLALLNESIWSLVNSDIDFPKSITSFARSFTQAREQIKLLAIPFLQTEYRYESGVDILIDKKKNINLSQSASGYQSIIPLLLVVEHQRQQAQRRFIIEEPELNLYPTAQKDLIYSLIGGLQPDIEYKEAEWVITTHSPYVLTSLNTLMLAYKVAQRSDELKEEVKKIVPERCWINPDDFAAYYVDNGTVESITNPETGLINDSRLDDVSEDFAGEQDKLFALYRTAVIND